MRLKLIGFIDTEDENKDYLSLEVPLFGDEEQQCIQVIDAVTFKVASFRDVTGLQRLPIDSSKEVSDGDDALYIYTFKNDLFIGNKFEADQYVSTKINTHKLSNFNLYSLYNFLGFRDKMLESVDSIVEASNNRLNYSNFNIPDIVELPEEEVILSEKAVASYSNVFFSLTETNYSDLLEHITYRGATHILAIKLGFYEVQKKFIISRLSLFAVKLPDNDYDFRLNDFMVGLLIIMKESLPEKSRFWNYISEEVVKSDTYTNNDVVDNIKVVQVASSTTFYLLHPNVQIAEESFVFKSFRLEKAVSWDIVKPKKLSKKENSEFRVMIDHIKRSHAPQLTETYTNLETV